MLMVRFPNQFRIPNAYPDEADVQLILKPTIIDKNTNEKRYLYLKLSINK